MSSAIVTDLSRPSRWGLAAKLFTTLVLLGAIAVLFTGVLGYFRARDALEKAIFDQLTAARQAKTRQVESYFRKIDAELAPACHLQDGGRCDARIPELPSISSTGQAPRPS